MRLRIKQIRKAKRMRNADLADLAGIRPATLSDIENGKSDPLLSTLEKIAEQLGCRVIDLFEDAPSPTAWELYLTLLSMTEEERQDWTRLMKRSRAHE